MPEESEAAALLRDGAGGGAMVASPEDVAPPGSEAAPPAAETESFEQEVWNGRGAFAPGKARTAEENKELRTALKLAYKKQLRFSAAANGKFIGVDEVFEPAAGKYVISHGVTKGEFASVCWRLVKKVTTEFDIEHYPDANNNGNFTARAVPGWDERNKMDRLELWDNHAAKQVILYCVRKQTDVCWLLDVIDSIDPKHLMSNCQTQQDRDDWAANLNRFPSLFVTKWSEACPVAHRAADWNIRFLKMDLAHGCAMQSRDQKLWLNNQTFGLDEHGVPTCESSPMLVDTGSVPAPGVTTDSGQAAGGAAGPTSMPWSVPYSSSSASQEAPRNPAAGWAKGSQDSAWNNWNTGGNSTGGNSGGWKKGPWS